MAFTVLLALVEVGRVAVLYGAREVIIAVLATAIWLQECDFGGSRRRNPPSAEATAVVDPDLVEHALQIDENPLTAREADVLGAAADGASTEEIGATLFPSPATVRTYLSNAIAKLGARNRIDAIRLARDAGWF